MHNMVMPQSSSYDSLDEECQKKVDDLIKGKSIKELRTISNYLSDLSYNMSQELEEAVTIDDFDKIKKGDESVSEALENEKESDDY